MKSSQLVRIGVHFAQGNGGLVAVSRGALRMLAGRFREARRIEPLELSQIFTRFAVGVVITMYAAVASIGRTQVQAPQLFLLLAAAWCVAFGSLAHILVWPEDRVVRRIISISMDALALSLFIHFGGRSAAIFFPIYLWMILGNGFRFGVEYMYGSMFLNALCFIIMVENTSYWRDDWQFSLGLFVAIIVIPIYTSSLIRKLRHAMIEAKAASEAKNEFLSMISHELRTPLNAILGLAQISRINAIGTQERQNAAFTEISANRLKRMLDTILKFQAIESGTGHTNELDFNFFETLAEIEAILAPLAAKKKLDFVLRFRSSVPEQLRSDPDILQTLILNIASNAIKYTKEGYVIVEFTLLRTPDARLRVETHDSGPGIGAELESRIFGQFIRHVPAGTQDEGGVGLGLSLCKSLTELMQGRIGFQSRLGEGSSFWFEIPIGILPASANSTDWAVAAFGVDRSAFTSMGPASRILSDEEAETLLSEAQEPGPRKVILIAEPPQMTAQERERLRRYINSAPHQPLVLIDTGGHGTCDFALQATALVPQAETITPDLISTIARWQQGHYCAELTSVKLAVCSSKTVLVADDDQMNRQVACRMLSLDGHKTFEAASGEEALELLLSKKIDIAILDVNMADLDGVEVCKTYLLSVDWSSAAKIVGLTADISEPTRRRCLAAGMREVLTKPLALDELRASLAAAADAIPRPANANEAAQQADVIDHARIDLLIQMFGHDALRNNLLPSFEKETASRIEHIKGGCRDLRIGDIRAHLHAIKSSAITIGASQLARRVSLLEEDRFDEAQRPCEILTAELNRFMLSCNGLLDRRVG
jgi:two-component system, sensor histidine kinase RpfC